MADPAVRQGDERPAFNPETGEVFECASCARRQHDLDLIAADLEAAENDLRTKRAAIGKLQRQLAEKHDHDEHAGDADVVFKLWKQRAGKNARTTFGNERRGPVLARLKDYPLVDVLDAVRFVAAFPNVKDARRVERGEGGRRFDDLELICRNGANVEKFRDAWREHRARRRRELRKLPPIERLGELLVLYPHPDGPDHHGAKCPSCGGIALVLEHRDEAFVDDRGDVEFKCRGDTGRYCSLDEMLAPLEYLEPDDLKL